MINIIPADEIAFKLVEDFKGEINPKDFGFVYRMYNFPPQTAPDRFIHGKVYGYRAQVPFYPASVVKVFFMVALFARLSEKSITLDREDERALANMIQISSNNATDYVFDRITDTSGGSALPRSEMDAWWKKRSWVQRYFEQFNWPEFDPVKVFHSTFDESPYGREQIARELYGGNLLTPLAAASLMHSIAARQIMGAEFSDQMMGLLSRDWERNPKHMGTVAGNQIQGFLVEAVPDHFKIWSKSGLTSRTRHDLVYAESPTGRAITMAAFSDSKVCSRHRQFLPAMGRYILAQADLEPPSPGGIPLQTANK